MTRTVKRGARTGSVDIISSKSYAHRLIILASLAKSASNIECRGTSKDIEATISCMNALGANIARTGDTIHIESITAAPEGVCELHCGESGSTLRFFIPIFSLTGKRVRFTGQNRLLQRPQTVYQQLFEAQGVHYSQTAEWIEIEGALQPGDITLRGDISWISPVARALLKAREGDTVTLATPAGPTELEIETVDYPAAPEP